MGYFPPPPPRKHWARHIPDWFREIQQEDHITFKIGVLFLFVAVVIFIFAQD